MSEPVDARLDDYGFLPAAWLLLDALIRGGHWNGKQEEAHAILADFTEILTKEVTR